MLSFTFNAPAGSGRGPVVLVFVIERENMARMTMGDPFDMQLTAMAKASPQAGTVLNVQATQLDIVIAYEGPEGIQKIQTLASQNDMAGVLQYLERGRTVYEGEPGAPVLDKSSAPGKP